MDTWSGWIFRIPAANKESFFANQDADKYISTVPIGTPRKGEIIIKTVLPLGNFGVQVMGEHRILTPAASMLGIRHNRFGTIHLADPLTNSRRSEDAKWTESYRLKPLGILSAPQIEEIL